MLVLCCNRRTISAREVIIIVARSMQTRNIMVAITSITSMSSTSVIRSIASIADISGTNSITLFMKTVATIRVIISITSGTNISCTISIGIPIVTHSTSRMTSIINNISITSMNSSNSIMCTVLAHACVVVSAMPTLLVDICNSLGALLF